MSPLAVLLGVACLRADAEAWRFGLTLAVCGAAVAGFHSLLYGDVIPERITPCSHGVSCTNANMTILGGLPLPMLALLAFGAIAALLLRTRPSMRSV